MAAFPEFLITRYECACHQSQLHKRFTRKPRRSAILTDLHMQMYSFRAMFLISQCLLVYFFDTSVQVLIYKPSTWGRGLQWKSYLKTSVTYMSGQMISGQVLNWQTYIRGRNPAATAADAREPHWKDRELSEDWAVEQHVQGVKKPIIVNQASAASQGGKEGKLYPDSGPPELACRVQHGGKSTGCHIHLDFYECFDSSPKDTPMTRWRVFIQACQTSKKWGERIFADPFRSKREREKKRVLLLF